MCTTLHALQPQPPVETSHYVSPRIIAANDNRQICCTCIDTHIHVYIYTYTCIYIYTHSMYICMCIKNTHVHGNLSETGMSAIKAGATEIRGRREERGKIKVSNVKF